MADEAVPSRRQHAVFLLYRYGEAGLRRVPRRVALAIGYWAGRLSEQITKRRNPARRDVVASNLAHVVGPTDPATLDRLVAEAFGSYGRYWADVATIAADPVGLLERAWTLEGEPAMLESLKAGRGVVLALPHLGSWEIGGLWAAAGGFPLTAVAERLEPPELFELFVEGRRELGITVVALGSPGGAPTLLSHLRSGGVVALVADRDLVGDGVEVEFFGEVTTLPPGPAALALRSGAALVPCAVYLDADGNHRGVLRPALDTTRHGRLREDIETVTTALAKELEVLIAAAPEQWHVFQPNWPSNRPT